MTATDWLRYGYSSIERDLMQDGTTNAFMPLPAETVYYSASNVPDQTLRQEAHSWDELMGQYDVDHEPVKPEDQDLEHHVEYVQIVQGKTVATFTTKELIFSRLTPDNDIDLNGYAISPLERAIVMVSNHLKVENHQSLFFTHGMASRGVLVIQGQVTPNQIRTLQAQWTQQVNGSQNAWRTPVLGGIKGVQWVELQPTNRDMEYVAYQDHVLRTIHACFAIDPEETGYGYLSKGAEQRSMSESSNEWKVEASRDKGLRPLLTRFEEVINAEVLPYANPEWAKKYRFCFKGLDAETRVEETERLSAEVQLHTTLNEARRQANKEPLEIGGNLILNPLFLQTLKENMPKGLFMEMFLGIQGASERPDLQYIPDPFYLSFLQMQMQLAQISAGAGDGDSGGGGGGGKDKKESGDPDKQKADEEKQARMQQAASDFMGANPELFKSYTGNLAKSRAAQRQIPPVTRIMLEKYRAAGNRLVADVLKILKEDGPIDESKKD